MAAIIYPITIEQGATYRGDLIQYTDSANNPIDLTLWSAFLKVRHAIGQEFHMISISSVENEILLGVGTIQFNIPANKTVMMINDGVYDLELVDPQGDVDRFMSGPAYVSRGVTLSQGPVGVTTVVSPIIVSI
jgi:hypothetical protein